MFFQQDWLMRQIDMFIQELVRLFDRELPDPFSEELNGYGTEGEADPLAAQLNALMDGGKINAAENLLFDRIGSGAPVPVRTGLDFYARLNRKSDEFLETHDFSREEVREGLEDFARAYGINLM